MTDFIEASVVVGAQLPSTNTRSIKFLFPNFENLQQKRGEFVRCPSLPCHGYLWKLVLYPRGSEGSNESVEHISVFLKIEDTHHETFRFNVMFRAGGTSVLSSRPQTMEVIGGNCGVQNFVAREHILNPASGCLVNGALTVVVDLQVPPGLRNVHWQPSSTLPRDMTKIYKSQDYCDVTFAVGNKTFHAHKAILAKRAPGFAEVFECESNKENKKDETIVIDGIEPSLFSYFLHYVYADELSDEIRTVNDAMAMLDLADKFDCTGLKLQVESKMAEAPSITEGNVLDLLSYADRRNCALLKEAAIGFFVAHSNNVMQSNAFKALDSPDLLREIMTATVHPRALDQQDTDKDVDSMSVAAMRGKLEKMGLDVDGSRETLVERLKAVAAAEGSNEGSREQSENLGSDEQSNNGGAE